MQARGLYPLGQHLEEAFFFPFWRLTNFPGRSRLAQAGEYGLTPSPQKGTRNLICTAVPTHASHYLSCGVANITLWEYKDYKVSMYIPI
jgi:hypothetical protein